MGRKNIHIKAAGAEGCLYLERAYTWRMRAALSAIQGYIFYICYQWLHNVHTDNASSSCQNLAIFGPYIVFNVTKARQLPCWIC